MYQNTTSISRRQDIAKNVNYQHNIYSAVRPIYYASKVMGLAPFSYTTNRTSIKSSWTGKTYTFLILLVMIICKAITMVGRLKYIYPSFVTTLIITDFMIWVSSGICMLASFVVATTCGQAKLVRILKKMSYIDEILVRDSSNNYRKIAKLLTFQLLLLYCIVCGTCAYDYFVATRLLDNELVMYIPLSYLNFLILYTMTAQFVNLILLIWHRYKILNSHLITKYDFSKTPRTQQYNKQDYVLVNDNQQKQAGKKKSEVILEIESKVSHHFQQFEFAQLRTLRTLHSLLNDCALLASSMYGFQMLLDIPNTFIRTTISFYNSVAFAVDIWHYDRTEDIGKKKHIFILNICWALIFFMKMISIALTCHLASSEANRSVMLLQKHLLTENNHNVKIEIQEFLQQVQNQRLQFKACGFFKIDLTMLRALTVAIFTYLLILMQFYIPN